MGTAEEVNPVGRRIIIRASPCLSLLVTMVLARPASGQTENRYSVDPAAGEQFGKAVAAARLAGALDWVVIGVPYAEVDGVSGAGEVECHPAIESPTTPPFKIRAPAGEIQQDAHFGLAVTVADIDGDSSPDIVVGAPGLDVGTRIDQGRVYIFFGPWNPLAQQPYSALTTLMVRSDDLDPNTDHGGEFGFSVAVGDLDHSGFLDLVVGAPKADKLGPPVAPEAGAADIFRNPPYGAADVTRYAHLQDNDVTENLDNHFGWSVGIGDFADPDAQDLGDVVVGDPDIDVWSWGWHRSAGATYAYFGHYDATNPVWNYNASFWQFLPSLPGTPLDNARRGTALAVGNYDGDSWDDLATGGPGAVDPADDPLGPEGFVFIYRGDGTGLIPPGVLDEPIIRAPWPEGQERNLFGFSLAWANTDGQDQLDLIIGAPGGWDTERTGAVYISHAVAGQVPRDWQKTKLTDGNPEADQRFGWAVARAHRGGTSLEDVLVGSPHSTALGFPDAGEIFVFKY
ncbi:MAG: integrin alpha [Thermodesulfobacteriota bacterium]